MKRIKKIIKDIKRIQKFRKGWKSFRRNWKRIVSLVKTKGRSLGLPQEK